MIHTIPDAGPIVKDQSADSSTMPRVSIVTVTYNAGQLAEKTLLSLAKQDYPDKEVIVVDGKSTDDTIDIIQRWDRQNVVSRWISEADDGIYDAMNKGVNMATGQWVIFMNAGDVFAADDVLRRIFTQDRHDIDVIYGDVMKHGIVRKAPDHYYLYHRMLFCHQCVLTRRERLLEVPFDTSHRLSADFKSFILLYQRGAHFRHVDIPVAVFDTGGVSNRQRSRGLRDNISVVCETMPMAMRLKCIAHLAVPYIICKLRGK